MVKQIVRDIFFLTQKSEPATRNDLQIGKDLQDTLQANREHCVGLAETGLIGKKQTLLDYGTGKGRVCFFMSYQTRCFSVGIEYNERIFQNAQENKKHAVSGSRTDFVMENAESYVIPEAVNRCYFFNLFSVEILRKVLARIYDSYYGNKRKILLFFYYPSDEYLGLLMTEEHLLFSDEISCEDLFPGENNRERILVFEVV